MRAATSSFIPEDKRSLRAFTLAVMADVMPGRWTMCYGVEVSWALPLYVAHCSEAKRSGVSLSGVGSSGTEPLNDGIRTDGMNAGS